MDTYCCPNGTNSARYPSAWYAFDAGVARFYVLEAAWSSSNVGTADEYKNDYDTHWTPSAPSTSGSQNDLEAHPSQLKFAFFHFPMYSSNATEASDTGCADRTASRACSARNGVAIGFSGHAHNYTRNDEAGRWPRDLRHRRWRRAAAAGHEVRRPGGVRDRLVVHDRAGALAAHRAAHVDRPGLPLPEGERRRRQGHGRAHRLPGADFRRPHLRLRRRTCATASAATTAAGTRSRSCARPRRAAPTARRR